MTLKADTDQFNLAAEETSEGFTGEEFRPQQVVCIEQGSLRLFAEVVQMVALRSRCWAKPLALAEVVPESLQLALRYDLRESSHLLLPATVFRAALDVELIPLMTALFHPEKSGSDEEWQTDSHAELVTRQALHAFIRDLAIDRL
jgi:hypothetical protein